MSVTISNKVVDGAITVSSKTTEKLFRDGWQFFCIRHHKGQIEEALKETQDFNREDVHKEGSGSLMSTMSVYALMVIKHFSHRQNGLKHT